MAHDIEFDPFESELGHTRSSRKLDTPPGSLVELIQVVVWVELGIQAGLEVLPTEEVHVMPRQPPHPQVSYEVGRVLVVVVHPLSTKRNYRFSFKLYNMYTIKLHPKSTGLV